MNWTNEDIIFWFKFKLDYFGVNGCNINVNFQDVYVKLAFKSPPFQSKLLPQLNVNDLENLGFKSVELTTKLQAAIIVLTSKNTLDP